jgi:transposase InsO family protein
MEDIREERMPQASTSEPETSGQKKRKPSSPEVNVSGGETEFGSSAPSKKKKYEYSEEKKKELRLEHFKLLHQIDSYKRTSSLPTSLKTKAEKQGFRRKAKRFRLVADQLHKESSPRPVRVLWEHEILPLLKELHESGAHYPKDQGKFRTHVEERFFFPQSSEITREFIRSCDTCQKEKAGVASRTDREMNPPPPTDPYFRVHVDLCGPFRNRQNKKRYIFVCLDSITKFASVKIIPNKKAAIVARAFEDEILDRQGCPFEVVADQGSEFNGEFEKLLKVAGLRHVRVRPRNPRANGQVERFMQILKSTLRATCHQHPSDWERFVQKVAFQYNVTYHETIRTSPFICLYARQPILPADHVFPSVLSEAVDQPSQDSFEAQLPRLEALRNVQRRSKLQIEQAQIKEKENFARWNVQRRPRSDPLSPGDYAIMQRPGNIRGFNLHWEGPCHFEGWTGPESNRQAILRENQDQVWHRHNTDVLSYISREAFIEKHIRPLQENATLPLPQTLDDLLSLGMGSLIAEPSSPEIVLEFDSLRPEEFPDFTKKMTS